MKLSEDLQVEILLVFGTVMMRKVVAQMYWQDVYDYLKTRHPDVLSECENYPESGSHDMGVLDTIFDYQFTLHTQGETI